MNPSRLLFLILSLVTPLTAQTPLNLQLPTDNRALFEGRPEDYYMYVVRQRDGKVTKPWTAGQYGFVRTLIQTEKEGIIATKFHEGLDIKPVRRDRNNNALDDVRAIADGEVVLVSKNAGGSSYGKYIVVQHNWGYGPFVSLYAHLATTVVETGQRVKAGTTLGRMGYTGVGLNRERSHLHLELGLISTVNFEDWLGATTNRGLYDGRNIMGIDVASLFLAHKKNPKLTIPQFLKGASPYFKVAVPRTGLAERLEIVQRYPWLAKGNHHASSASWEIAFTDSGIPLEVIPSHREVTQATVTYVRTTRSNHKFYTRKRLSGTGSRATLTRSGRKFIALFTNEYTKPKSTPAPQPANLPQ